MNVNVYKALFVISRFPLYVIAVQKGIVVVYCDTSKAFD